MEKFCPKCGTKAVEDKSLFCDKCGTQLPVNIPENNSNCCPNCGAKILDKESTFCNKCGSSLTVTQHAISQSVVTPPVRTQPVIKYNKNPEYKKDDQNKFGRILSVIIISGIFYALSTFFIPYGESILVIKSSWLAGGFTEFYTILGYTCLALGWFFRIFPIIGILIIIAIITTKK